MKKILPILLIITFVLFSANSYAQVAQDSWGFGFGGSYPKFLSTGSTTSALGYGGYLSLNRDFSEHSGMRFYIKYSHLENKWGVNQLTKIESFLSGAEFTYRFVPCETVTPYLSIGAGGNFYILDNPQTTSLGVSFFEPALTLTASAGILWRLSTDWNLTTEFSYLSVGGSKFDGNKDVANGGILGGVSDSYMTFDLGFLYYFDKGAPSKICQLYSGISVSDPDPIDYERIENIVKKHIPREVVKEVVVEKPVKSSDRKWVLVGVNFDYSSTKLSSESFPILFHAVQVLLNNPDMQVEIQGYTDNIGSEKANLKLSEKRAQMVKNYLVARGVDGNRLKVVGYGEAYPIADNKTADGRSMNRRIEFKVLN